MQSFLSIVPFLFLHGACTTNATIKTYNPGFGISIPKTIRVAIKEHGPDDDTIPPSTMDSYSLIEYEKKELLNAAPGTKSVLFNRDGSKLYAMNLEGMSVYEFDQATRQVVKEFKFKPTKGTGWDYEKDKPIPSYEEKPVEACLSHDDKILWVSLHNAEGIVPIRLDSMNLNVAPANKKLSKKS